MPNEVEAQVTPRKSILQLCEKHLKENMPSYYDLAPPRYFRDEGELETYVRARIEKMLKAGDYAYDPTIGQITFSLDAELNVLERVGHLATTSAPGEVIGTHLIAFFKAEGWENAFILPAKTGNNKVLMMLQCADLTSSALTGNSRTPLQRATDATLKAAKNPKSL